MLARWNENMLCIQDSAAVMAYIYFSPAKCSRAAAKDKPESNRNPLKISTHSDLGGFGSQILPLIILNSFPSPGALSLSRWEGRFCWPCVASSWAPLPLWGFSSVLCWHQWSSHSPAESPSTTHQNIKSCASVQLLQCRVVGVGDHKERPWQPSCAPFAWLCPLPRS